MLPQHLDRWLATFPAKLTAVTNTSGTYLYDWTEQITDGSGGYTNAEPGRSGNSTVDPARELNNLNFTPANTVVWMRFRGMSGANTVYEFDGSGTTAIATTPSTAIIVQDDTGTPSYTGINTLNVVTGTVTGLTINNTAANTVQLSIVPASSSTAGVMNTGVQTFAGVKTFDDDTNFAEAITVAEDVTVGSANTGGFGGRIFFDGGTNHYIFQDENIASTYDNVIGSHITGSGNTNTRAYLGVATASTAFVLDSDHAQISIRVREFGAALETGQSTTVLGAMKFVGGVYIGGAPGSGAVPANSGSSGAKGEYAMDGTYFYGCYAANSWGRIAWDSTSF